jgi:hypothetical protein
MHRHTKTKQQNKAREARAGSTQIEPASAQIEPACAGRRQAWRPSPELRVLTPIAPTGVATAHIAAPTSAWPPAP